MALQCLGRQPIGLSTPNGGHEVGQVRRFQSLRASVVSKIFDLLVLLIKERAAGSIAGEVTAFAVNHDATVLLGLSDRAEPSAPIPISGIPSARNRDRRRGFGSI